MARDPTSLTAFHGTAWCHVPADEPVRLEELAGADGGNRWNRQGQPTLYLALDLGVAIAEMARHLDLAPDDEPVRRRLIGMSVRVHGLIDLRTPGARRNLGGPAGAAALLDRDLARRLADRARSDEACLGLLTPSMAFLDDPSRGNLVLFMDRWPGGVDALAEGITEAGVAHLRPARA